MDTIIKAIDVYLELNLSVNKEDTQREIETKFTSADSFQCK